MLFILKHAFYPIHIFKKISGKICLPVVAGCVLLAASCKNNKPQVDSHPEYFDKVFKHAAHLEVTDSARALPYLYAAFKAFPDPGPKDLFLKYRFIDDYYSTYRKDFFKAQLYNDSALWAIRDHIHEKAFAESYADGLFNEGFLLVQQKKYEEAFAFDLRARQTIETSGNICLQGTYSATLGWISNLQGKYLNAARYTRQAVHQIPYCSADEYDKFQSITEKLDDIGIYYFRGGIQDSALYFFKAALDTLTNGEKKFVNKTSGNDKFIKVYRGIIWGNMGSVYYKTGDTATAERLFKESIKMNNRKGYEPGDSQFTLIKLATLYLDKKRLTEAKQVLATLRISLNELPDANQELKYYRLQLDYLDKSNNGNQSYKYIKPYLKIQDSIAQIKPIPQVDIHAEYERLKNRYNLVLLQKNDQLKTVELIVIITVTLLIAGILLVVWYSLKRSRKNVLQLTGLNNRITDQNKQMESTLNVLEQAQKENNRLMKVVAHDLRSPISSMFSLTSLLLESPERSSYDKTVMELIKTSGQNCMNLVSDLLNANIMQDELKNQTVDLAELLGFCVDQLTPKATEKKQRIVLYLQSCSVPGSAEKLWRVISNLIGNAIKFSPDGSTITVTLEAAINGAMIAVKDTGIGIPDELKEHIFNMNSRTGRTGTNGEESFGMGLGISKQIIEAHSGKIWFESELGVGTTFYVELVANQ